MLPNSVSVPISKRIRQTFGDKLLLLAADTQEGASSESNNDHKTKQKKSNVAFQTAGKATAFHLGLRLKIRLLLSPWGRV